MSRDRRVCRITVRLAAVAGVGIGVGAGLNLINLGEETRLIFLRKWGFNNA